MPSIRLMNSWVGTDNRREPQQPLRVYLAGKVGKHDWRHQIVPDLRNAANAYETPPGHPDFGNPFRFGRFLYTGPFFVSCDHGCYHGDGTHGIRARSCECGVTSPSRDDVVRLCRRWLDRSDVVFAWLDDPSAYGTVAEIGYAVAKRTPVFLFEPTEASRVQRDDMWFVRRLADYRDVATDAKAAWEAFCEYTDGW